MHIFPTPLSRLERHTYIKDLFTASEEFLSTEPDAFEYCSCWTIIVQSEWSLLFFQYCLNLVFQNLNTVFVETLFYRKAFIPSTETSLFEGVIHLFSLRIQILSGLNIS